MSIATDDPYIFLELMLVGKEELMLEKTPGM